MTFSSVTFFLLLGNKFSVTLLALSFSSSPLSVRASKDLRFKLFAPDQYTPSKGLE
jgi:hypothetical protein